MNNMDNKKQSKRFYLNRDFYRFVIIVVLCGIFTSFFFMGITGICKQTYPIIVGVGLGSMNGVYIAVIFNYFKKTYSDSEYPDSPSLIGGMGAILSFVFSILFLFILISNKIVVLPL